MLNVIVCIRTVWLRTVDCLILRLYLHLNCVFMLNWIVSNGTVFDIETVFTLNGIVWYRTVLNFNCV